MEERTRHCIISTTFVSLLHPGGLKPAAADASSPRDASHDIIPAEVKSAQSCRRLPVARHSWRGSPVLARLAVQGVARNSWRGSPLSASMSVDAATTYSCELRGLVEVGARGQQRGRHRHVAPLGRPRRRGAHRMAARSKKKTKVPPNLMSGPTVSKVTTSEHGVGSYRLPLANAQAT